MKPFRRVRKRDKPVWQEEQKEEPYQRVRKRDKPVVKKKNCYVKMMIVEEKLFVVQLCIC